MRASENSVVRMSRRRDQAGHHSRAFTDDVSTSPMPRNGNDTVIGGLVNVSGSKGAMMQIARDAGNRPSAVPPGTITAGRDPLLIRGAQGPRAVSVPMDVATAHCPECSNYAGAGRGPAEWPSDTLAHRFEARA